MKNDFQKINLGCSLCNSKDIEFFTSKNSYNLYKCKSCGLIFVWPMPENYSKIYSSDYFKGTKKVSVT